MKNLLLIALLLPLIFSCSKKKGCNYKEAVNFDEMVVVDDGTCTYTNLTFYTDLTKVNGHYIDHINVAVEATDLGSFNGTATADNACSGGNTVTYAPEDNGTYSWTSLITLRIDTLNPQDTLYYYHHDSTYFNTGLVTTSPILPCAAINAVY